MKELKNWYRERVPIRIAALEAARQGVAKNTQESIQSVRRIAHSLRGSGATYGFPEITEAARELEKASDRELSRRMDNMLSTLRSVAAEPHSDKTEILIIEDDEEQAENFKAELETSGRILHMAHTAAHARTILNERQVSLVVLDLILPDLDGRSFLLNLRDRLAMSALPVVVVTCKGTEQVRDECMALGADDFIEKPFAAGFVRDVVSARLRKGADRVRHMRQDALTGLANRALFYEILGRYRCAAKETKDPLSVALLDIDRLRSINDRCGYEMGDQVLRRFAMELSRAFRTGDLVARWGGGTFAVAFPHTSEDAAVVAMRKALGALRTLPFSIGDNQDVRLTFSAGVVEVPPDGSAEEVMFLADRQVYLAKEMGRDRILSRGVKVRAPKKRIIIAEDDELIRMVLVHLLKDEGFEVMAFADGASALSASIEAAPSMVISDVQMPRMDGFELLSSLRSLPQFAQVPIVLVTSMGEAEDIVRGFGLGADEYIQKPFSSADLRARIRSLLRNR